MQQIKFKGLDEKGKYYDLLGINWENMTGLCQVENVNGWSWCRFEKFVQFTGQTDVDGAEVYFDDILLSEDGKTELKVYYTKLNQIILPGRIFKLKKIKGA